ncbi:L-threonylcarbamoyladenylate synthase [Massilibacterium senegalense]|uniref:L-threonylcarbamoyladenylate synthase n=1 Tax=Massilibacterium senegalense TaxID=1632858 RepID=UPI000784238F|nr:L-threonylcarbamoyladenylate synthase [Massilibacterium senegalense]
METTYWIVDSCVEKEQVYPQIKEASDLLKQNEVVAFPTETVYGLGANAWSDEAVQKVFQAKGRPSDNPLIVHIASRNQLESLVVDISEVAKKCMDVFWPGPLTIVMKRKEGLSNAVTAGLSTVGIRMPDHPIALALIKEANLPIAAPSANVSGKPSPTTAAHVKEDLDGKIAGIVDGGATGVGVESTVIDCTTEGQVIILRPGGITKEQLENVTGVDVLFDDALFIEHKQPKAPGMKYTHYAPNAPLYLVEGSPAFMQARIDEKRKEGLKVGVLTTAERKEVYQADTLCTCGYRNDLASVNHHLYDVLRKFNHAHVDIIFSETFPKQGVGVALMNRLEKAAGKKYIREYEEKH